MDADTGAASIEEVLDRVLALPADWHGAGSLDASTLAAIARHARAIGVERSVETGAGKSTLVLSHVSNNHTVFALDHGASISKVRDSPILKAESVVFVEGPTQRTVPNYVFQAPLDLVLLDGPHGFPYPQLEYYYLYRHIRTGGALIIDDIQIPTINQMFDFLSSDSMFDVNEVVGKTAFFRRTTSPTFDPYGDGWWEQAYNQSRALMPWRDSLRIPLSAFAALPRQEGGTAFIDTIGGNRPQLDVVEIPRYSQTSIVGWAVDSLDTPLSDRVYVVLERVSDGAVYELHAQRYFRIDVPRELTRGRSYSGISAVISDDVDIGEYTLTVLQVTPDRLLSRVLRTRLRVSAVTHPTVPAGPREARQPR